MQLRHLGAALALALPLLAGCRSDDELASPDLSTSNGMFQRYVSMGNSITAGFQGQGIGPSTQLAAYPVLVAQAAGASGSFNVPLLAGVGCPPPLSNNVTGERVVNGVNYTATTCQLRSPSTATAVSNVAVPGVRVQDVLSNSAGAQNFLTQLFLGGIPQVEAMQRADPTFVSVWLGNNDVLGSLTSSTNPGNTAVITSQDNFQDAYGKVLGAVSSTEPQGAILIGVVDVTNAAYASPGALWFCLKNGCPGVPANPAFPANFQVDLSCAPIASGAPTAKGDSVLVPFTVGAARLGAARAGATGAAATLDCTQTNQVVLPAEFKALRDAVAGYNAYISAQATRLGYAYWDPNPTLAAGRARGDVSPFPLFGTTATAPITFGSWISLDGVHPSSLAHRVIADSVIATVNRVYGTTIPQVQ